MTRALALAALLLAALPSPASVGGDVSPPAAALVAHLDRAVLERMLAREMLR